MARQIDAINVILDPAYAATLTAEEWASLQHDDVPRARRMFDVLGRVETGGDFQAQHLDVKASASLDVIALQGAVGKSLRQITAAGKAIDG